MKKTLQKILLMAMLCVPWVTQAQVDTLTVANGTATNSYIPVYGYYVDAAQHNQIIYPASMLAALAGDSIKGMGFYISSTSNNSWGTTLTVSMGITTATTLSGLDGTTALTQVGTVTTNGQSDIWIQFDNPYPFMGGNLLVDIQTTTGTWGNASFVGESQSGNTSVCNYYSSNYFQSFIPKTSFLHVQGAFEVCDMPTNLMAIPYTYSVDLSWTAADGVSSYNIYIGDSLIGSTSSTSYTVDNLAPHTAYTFKVKSSCGSSESPALMTTVRTGCEGTQCDVTIALSSSYSYAWDYNYFNVYQYGDQLASFNSDGNHTVTVCSGDTVEVQYQYTYSWGTYYQSYVSYDIMDGGNVSYSSGAATNLSNGQVVVISNPCPTCIPPSNLRATLRTDEQIDITWNPRSEESEWIIYLNDSIVGSAYDTTYSFYNLTANTNYTVGVQSVCSIDDSSNIITKSYKTACGEMTIPSVWDWEDIDYNGAWPSCWTRLMNHSTDPSVNSQRNHTAGGTYSMYLSADYDYNMFVSDAVPLDGDAINVRFWAYMPTYGSPVLEAGVMTNPDDTGSFTQLITITDQTGSWNEYEFNTTSMDGNQTYYVAFRYYSTYAYYYASIDDITISEYSNCQRPAAGWVDTVGYYSAQLSWNQHPGASGYYVYYNPGTTMDSNVSVYVSDTTVLLTNLLPQTMYTAFVVTDCGSSTAGDYRPIGPFTTMTTCAPVTNVTLENVSQIAAQIGWEYDETYGFPYNGVKLTLIDNDDSTVAPQVHYNNGNLQTYTNLQMHHNYTLNIRTMCDVDGGLVDTANGVNFTFTTLNCPGLEILDNNSAADMTSNPLNTYYNYSYAQNLYMAVDMPNVDTINGISFRTSSTSNYDYTIDVYMGNTTRTSLSTTDFEPTSNMTKVASSYIIHPSTSGWQHIVFDTPFVYNGTSNVVVAIDNNTGVYHSTTYWYSHQTDYVGSVWSYGDGTNYDPSTISSFSYSANKAIDIQFDVECVEPTCMAPMVIVSNIDSNGFQLSWVPVGEATTFIVTLDGAIEMMSNATSYNVTNLLGNTVHVVGVGALCSSSNDTMWSYRTVRTECSNMSLPYYKDFENDDVNKMATCWTTVAPYTYSGVNYPVVTNDGYNSNKALRLYANGSNIAVTSAIPNSGNQGDKYHIQFYAYVSSSYSTGQAGVMSDPNDELTFIPLKNLTNDDAWHRYDMYTSGLDPFTTYYAAFRYDGSYSYGTYYSMLIDNVMIEHDLGCHYPQNLSADVDSTSVTLHWDNTGTQPAFVVAYRANGEANYSFMTAQTDTSAVVSGLNSATTYEFRVGNLCSGGDTLWENIVVTTNCGVTMLPFFDDFASETISPCYVLPTSGVQYYDGGLFWSSYTGPGYPAVLPYFDSPISKLEIEFKTKVGPVSQGDAILVGVADAAGNFIQWVDTLTDANQSRSTFVWMDYRFDEYSGAGDRIVLGRLYTGGDWALIDNITVRMIPGCLPVDSLEAHNLFDPDSSYFTWSNPGLATSFLVYVDTITVDTTGIPTSSLISVTTNSYVIPSGVLQGGGKYRFFIKSDCVSNQSPWKIVEFGSGEVIMSQSGVDTVTSCGMVIYDNGGPIAGYYSAASSSLVMYPSAVGNRLQIYGAFLSFYNDGATTLTIYDGDNANGTILYQTSYSGPTIKYDSIVSLPLATSTDGPLMVTFSGGTYVNPGFELYVRCIPIVACDEPTYIQTTSVGIDSASLNWYGNSSAYDVYYREAGTSTWSVIATSSEAVTLSGLNAATTYEVQIQAICSSEDSSNMSSIFSFMTECDATVITLASPLVEDFEGDVVPPTCFQLVYGLDGNAVDNPVTFDASAAYSGVQGLRFSSVNPTMGGNYNQTLISPRLEGDSAMVVSFYVRASSGTETFRVGYSTQADDLSSDFNWQQSITVNNTWMHYVLNVPGNTKYVAINYMPTTTGYYLYVDSLVISINDGNVECNAPVITGSQSTQNSITVAYAANGLVEMGIVAGTEWDSTVMMVSIPAASSYTFTHLTGDTAALESGAEYTIGIRTLCGENFYSDWVTLTTSTLSENCVVPTLLTVGEVGSMTAVLTWNGGAATSWEVYYTTGNEENSQIVNSSTVTLTGLSRNTLYTAKVRAVCGLAYSDWSSSVTFTTLGCQSPTSLGVTGVTQTEANLYWSSSDASSWEIAWGTYGFEMPYGTVVTSNTTSYHLSGLTAGTTYSFMVRAVCADDETSEWSDRYNFATTPVIGIEEVDASDVTVYPNPATGSSTVSVQGMSGEVEITVVDLSGRTVKTKSIECDGTCSTTIDVSGLASGSYFVRVKDANGNNTVKKLIVK